MKAVKQGLMSSNRETARTHGHIDESLQLVPTHVQPTVTSENPTMLPKNNIESAKAAGKIMGVGKTLVIAAKAIAKASAVIAIAKY